MEVVRNFNNELSSLYEVKPPISKAKMTQITKSAIKGLKYYKHIVQSVEKFIQKCRPEYKVPGLYVIDSIVRQSRHQFGPEKDVFAPRFAKNIATTFQNLFKCTEEDRSKVVRVLNLWQKNSVFPSDVIQPLMDMANPNTNESLSQPPTSEIITHNSKSKSAELAAWKNWPQANEDNFEDGHGYAEMSTRNLEKFTKANAAGAVNLETAQLPQNMPVKNEMPVQEDNTVKFNRKLLDFDYGDEDEEEEIRNEGDQMPTAFNPLALSMAQNLLSNPELLQQLQQMQQTIQQSEALKSELGMTQPPQQQSQIPMEPEMKDQYSPDPPEEHVPLPESSAVSAMPYQEPHPPHSSNVLPFQFEAPVNYPAQAPQVPVMEPVEMAYQHSSMVTEDDIIQSSQVDEDDRVIYSMPGEPPLPPQDLDERAIGIPTLDDHIPKDDSRSRSDSRTRRSGRHRSRSRSPRRRKSRSRSRSRSRRKRSRSRDRERERERQREREREREREYERRKKGIPPIKKNYMTVCSTTLWMGHVPKTMAEEDINSILCEYGTVSSIDMIPPRGCAYVAMDRRQDAYRALQKLKNLKLRGSSIKVAWAPGKGVKGKEYKDYWEVDSGVSYIPFDKLPNDGESLDLLEEGGFIDEDSMPSDLLEIRRQEKEKMVQMEADVMDSSSNRLPAKDAVMSSAPVAAVTSAVMPPSSMGMPLVMPQMMQTPQYGMVLPSQPPMVMPLPVGVPPPNPMMMVQPPSQTVLAGTPLPVGSVPQMPHLSMPHQSVVPSVSSVTSSATTVPSKTESVGESSMGFSGISGDATPTEEDGTSVSSPGVTSAVQASSVGSGASVSVAPLGPHVGTQFAGVGHHGVVRPMLPVLPPVSSAGAPIPFPPPQVGFGFPPPPLRPTIPSQNLPGVLSVPNSPFPWMQKASAPAFTTYGDSDMRFTVHGSSTASPVNMRPVTPAAAQQATVDMSSLSSQPSVNQQHAFTQSTSQPVSTSSNMSPLKGKEADSVTTASTSDGFGSKADMSSSHMDTFGVADDVQQPFDKSSDVRRLNKDEPRDVMHAYSDAELAAIPRFPGPPDFHPVPGAMRMPWLHGPPGPRFPPAFNPNAPFPPRGGPRPMDLDFFRHQVPRLHLPGSLPLQQPQQQQQRWKNDNFSPQRGQDHYPGRRDYRDNHYDDDDQGRRHRSRDDWGRRRERWEERGRRNDDRDESSSRSGDRGSRSEERRRDRETSSSRDSRRDRDEKDSRRDEKKTSSSSSDKEPAKSEKSSVPKPVQNSASSLSDLADDLFRLQSYGGRGRVANVTNFKSNTSKSKNETKNRDDVEDPSRDQSSEKSSRVETQEKKVVDPSDCGKATDDARTESGENGLRNEASSQDVLTGSGDTTTLQSSGQENRSRRDRDRKRSRWGRTLSQEREFQQQKQEMERQAQNDTAVLHPDEREPCHNREGDVDTSSKANVSSSGAFEIENLSGVPNLTVMVEPGIEGPCKGAADTNSIAAVEPSSSSSFFSEAPCEVNTMSSSFTNETPMELSNSPFLTDIMSES